MQDLGDRIARRARRNGACLDWTGGVAGGKGRGAMMVRIDGRKRMCYVTRVVWEMHHGPIPEGMQVCHSCDRPSCIEVTHLFLGLPADNTRDMWAKGRGKVPEPGLGNRVRWGSH